ncbi:MAG TPA: hypothetical protein VMU42_18865 [Candidatus Sulfotelmatobacter sp.]|nr:hypothetical protein [Candidatus Sulfotelmatobacter sp.]
MRSAIPICLAALCFAGTAAAQSMVTPATVTPLASDPVNPPQAQRQGDITFVTGGVGDEGRSEMQQVAPRYNLRLLFAQQGTGAYLADVTVNLDNARGQPVLAAKSDGPLFYADVPPGRYKLVVAYAGRSQTRPIDVGHAGAIARSFYWP